jgi:hypothetical protein
MRVFTASILLILIGAPAAMADPITLSQAAPPSGATPVPATPLLAAAPVPGPGIAGSTVLYGDLGSWQAAATGELTTISFEENASGQFTYHGAIASFGGVRFHSDADLYTVDPAFDIFYQGIGTGDVLTATRGQTLTIVGVSATALALDWQVLSPSPLAILLSNGDAFLLPISDQAGFFGLTSTVPLTSLQLTYEPSLLLNIDNFRSNAAPVPEPASLSLLALGLAGLGAQRWRQRKV